MKKFISMMMLTLLAVCFVSVETSAQTASDNYLKIRGKILDNHTADITVWAENDGDWIPVRTLKSRTKYSIKLNPEENYYILFEDKVTKLTKVLHVDAGSTGMWIMQLDVNFDQKSIKYARLYQAKEDYKVKVVYKDNQRIVIGRTSDDNTEVLSQHEGK